MLQQRNSSQALQWAMKKKQMLHKARKLQDQHKYGLAPPSPSPADEPKKQPLPSTEPQAPPAPLSSDTSELEQARAALTLLKRKMSARRANKENEKPPSSPVAPIHYRQAFKPVFSQPSKPQSVLHESSQASPAEQDLSRFSSYAAKPEPSPFQEASEIGQQRALIECEDCGRKFMEKALLRHSKVCKRVFGATRKKFDITTRRAAKGVEDVAPTPLKKKKTRGTASKWKAQSQMFRAAMRSARGPPGGGGTTEFGTGAFEAVASDLMECKFCGRSFNEAAWDRHTPICEKKFKQKQMEEKYKKRAAGAGASRKF